MQWFDLSWGPGVHPGGVLELPPKKSSEVDQVSVRTVGGTRLCLSRWFCNMNGHELNEYWFKTYARLKDTTSRTPSWTK
jgi:hypothetical protein